jgi:hypothetical protein
MADTIQVERWHRPWEPAKDARLLETLNYYDMPLSGIVEQHGVKHLFDCIAGHLEHQHLWVYRCLTDQELAEIEEPDTPERLRSVLDDLLSRGPMTLAVADDDDGIWGSTVVDSLENSEIRDAFERIIDDFQSYLASKGRQIADSHSQLRAQLLRTKD